MKRISKTKIQKLKRGGMPEREEWEIFEMEKIAVLKKKLEIIHKTNINNINITQSLKRYFIGFINERY